MTYFSVAALFIMFREALEAAVIISVMLQLVEKMKMSQLKKHGERGSWYRCPLDS